MAEPKSVAILAACSVLATGIGVFLGKSAIAEIDPLYFSGPGESRFYADLTANRSPDWAAVQVREVQAMAVNMNGLGSGCIKCRDYPEEYVPRSDPAIEAAISGDPAPVRYASHEAEAAVIEVAAPDPELERIERYAAFRVSEDEADEAQEPADRPILIAEATD